MTVQKVISVLINQRLIHLNKMITKVWSSSLKELVDHKINSKTNRNFLKFPSWLNKIITKNDDNLGIMHIK